MLVLLRIGVGLLAGGLLLLFHTVAIALGCLVYVYLLPGVIAMKRHYVRTERVFIVCAIFGWTVIGWLGLLAFALALPVADDPGDPALVSHH